MADLEFILHFLEDTFDVSEHPDSSRALNGLQVAGGEGLDVKRLAAAVDASEETILEAVAGGADLLLVHHGLFWGGTAPLTGVLYRKVSTLIRNGVALYSLHLPLDGHPEFGNNALLLRELGLEPEGRFGWFQDVQVGWWATASHSRDEFLEGLEAAVGRDCRVIPGGPERVERVGVVTGGGASSLREAAGRGLDSLVTGEAPHHAYHEAMELGVNLFLGGHYATETFGVKELSANLAGTYDLSWEFLHFPTGL